MMTSDEPKDFDTAPRIAKARERVAKAREDAASRAEEAPKTWQEAFTALADALKDVAPNRVGGALSKALKDVSKK